MHSRLGTHLRTAILLAAVAAAASWVALPTPAAQKPSGASHPKFVFLFVADGGGIPHMEITRLYNQVVRHEGLAITDKVVKEGFLGLVTTHSADSLSTDSAAAATALASGCKANIGALGICSDGTIPRSAMEIAKARGMRIGLVTTAPVYDATPAAFVSHLRNRRDYAAVVQRYLELEPDLILGGGREQFMVRKRRGGAAEPIARFRDAGYRYVSNADELARLPASTRKVLGLFSEREMGFEIDRDSAGEPSLTDMMRAAIRLLGDGNAAGFFLLLENENVDTAAHHNDIAALIREYREFDRAVALAYDFYRRHPNETLIVVTSDHETGGLSFTLALKDPTTPTPANFAAATQADLRKIDAITLSLQKAARLIGANPTAAAVEDVVNRHFPGFTLAPDIKEAIVRRRPLSRTVYLDATINGLGLMVANNTQAYWQTSAHTNHPVFVAAVGVGAERFRGYQDNAELGRRLRAVLQGPDGRG